MKSKVEGGRRVDMLCQRKKLGLTQKQVADAAHIHWKTYAAIERGEQDPGYQTMLDIAKVLQMEFDPTGLFRKTLCG